MSVLRWHRLSFLWKNWMFNQEPAEEPGSISQAPQDETGGNAIQDIANLKTQNLDPTHQNSELTDPTVGFINVNVVGVTHKSGELIRSLSEPCSHSEVQTVCCPHKPEGCVRKVHQSCSELAVDAVLQVDNGSEGDDSFLQREGSQRRSRRRFRRINPRGERELITDGQEPTAYTTVRVTPWQRLHFTGIFVTYLVWAKLFLFIIFQIVFIQSFFFCQLHIHKWECFCTFLNYCYTYVMSFILRSMSSQNLVPNFKEKKLKKKRAHSEQPCIDISVWSCIFLDNADVPSHW